jgi:hypothetical protein
VLTKDEIADRIAPISDDIVTGYLTSWRSWLTEVKERPHFTRPLGPTERANVVHAHACQEVELLVAKRGYAFNTALGFKALAVGTDLLVRFKYQRGGASPANVRTDQQISLGRQEFTEDMMATLALEGFTRPPEFVTAGYILNLPETDISRVVIRRDCLGYQPLQFDLYSTEALTFAEPLTLPNIEEPVPAPIRSTRPAAEETAGSEDA